ncbi:hypothetical protein CVS40_8408 [Lucilia cuprina]|nr:hypothetical protein CVS40_8408 [Lucilia cuprina]
MTLNCHFNSCQWCGGEDEIFDHIESHHKKFLREPKGNLYYDFKFEDLQQEAFVLCSPNGLYWLRKNPQVSSGKMFEFGVFHIGESEQVEFTLKLGLKREGHCEYWGPYESKLDLLKQPDRKEFILRFDGEFLNLVQETMPSQCLRLYFGNIDDSNDDDKLCPGPEDFMEWSEEDEEINALCIEQFTCPICFEYIKHDARSCENRHFICCNCFEEMQQRKKLKCPTCRGQYLYDCINEDVNRFLGMIRWPDVEIKKNDEMVEWLKSMPNVEFVQVKGGENV